MTHLRITTQIACCLLFLHAGYAQKTLPRTQKASFRVMFYNVENLFDCEHDEGKDDYEFLPDRERKWTPSRYFRKLNNVAKVITNVGEWQSVALVGLCEVENEKVMRNLTASSILKKEKYSYLITRSPDRRGINVALLYQRDVFKPLQRNDIEIKFRNRKNKTRDILHVAGKVRSGDTLDVFVCHFPSRSGGEKATEGSRNFVATVLKKYTDSIMTVRKTPNLLIMGDFNDYPTNASLYHILKARPETDWIPPNGLCNLFYKFMLNGKGTYKYQREWNVIDQIIVSGNLLDSNRTLHVKTNSARIFYEDFLLEKDKSGGMKPHRTYRGTYYAGGFSDHLPVCLDLIVEN